MISLLMGEKDMTNMPLTSVQSPLAATTKYHPAHTGGAKELLQGCPWLQPPCWPNLSRLCPALPWSLAWRQALLGRVPTSGILPRPELMSPQSWIPRLTLFPEFH